MTPEWTVDDEGHLHIVIRVSDNAYLVRKVPVELELAWYERAFGEVGTSTP